MPSNVSLALAIAASLAFAMPAMAQDGPPPSDGPSATSDRSPDRYDEVGFATEQSSNRTAAQATLPIGSYVEVTSLETGRTVLVQIDDRGPSTPGLLIDLSQAAARAIGVDGRKPVRVRRVMPTPADQNALKNGQAASPILDTPPALLAGLRAKLAGGPGIPAKRPPTRPTVATPRVPAEKAPTAVKGSYYVQVAAFGSQDRAAAIARGLGGSATPFNNLWRVRTGPFPDAKSAAQARDAVAARGYGDARVVRQD